MELLLLAISSVILLDTSPGAVPMRAASGALSGMGIPLFFALILVKSRKND